MKKIYLIIYFSILYVPNVILAQSYNDKNELISQCVSLQALFEKIPKETQKKLTNYYILNHGIDFDNSLNLEAKGKKISFLEKADINTSKPYFLFHTLNVDGNTAFVRFYFTYTVDMLEKTLPITINFQKKGTIWEIVNYSI